MESTCNAGNEPRSVAANRGNWSYRQFPTTGLPVETYRLNHSLQTLDFVLDCKKKVSSGHKSLELDVWEACQLLSQVNDESDPDNDLPQILHAYQTGEKLREVWPEEEYEWLHLTGFIHDLGKVLATKEWDNQPQWAVVGDTFPVGCQFSEKNVYSDFFGANPDSENPQLNSLHGIYQPNCGFDSVHMSWGHDEYMYQILKMNENYLPEEVLYVTRYHSFYPWHREAAYGHLADSKDLKMLSWLQDFSNCDLYSKFEGDLSSSELENYYRKLINKYFKNPVLKWNLI